MPIISSGLVVKRLKSVSFSDLFYLWVFIQLLWAGHLSVEDLKNVLKGMLSVSGIVFLSVVIYPSLFVSAHYFELIAA